MVIGIQLSSRKYPGLVATVDDEDYALVSAYSWAPSRCDDKIYACANITLPDGRRTSIKMHRLLLNPPPGLDVDHVDRNGLNNTRANLRTATRAQNNANARKRVGTASQYKGISFHRDIGKWTAEIKHDKKRWYLGLFHTAEEAARAYDAKAREFFGPFARFNFPDEAVIANEPPTMILPNPAAHAGSRNSQAKLDEQKVREIRRLASEGVSKQSIAARFSVCDECVRGIIKGITWKHVAWSAAADDEPRGDWEDSPQGRAVAGR